MADSSTHQRTFLWALALSTLAGCHAIPTKATAPATSGDVWAVAPQVTVEVVPPPAHAPPPAPAPPPRPTAERMWLPDGCTAAEEGSTLTVTCPDGGLEVQWDHEPPAPDRLDTWTDQTIASLKSGGMPMVLLGEPTCTVQEEPVDCTRVLGRSAAGVEETLFLAVGSSPDGGAVEVSCHWSKLADERSFQNLCQQVLRRI
ncbi:MAG: hypothetical protein KDA24_09205 [Deltaproteobacteria bacterium]|nr:hypothetical protein [Deltaproteobacteria bacterium]